MDQTPRAWIATYRLQLNRDFTFDDVAAIAPYLADLGVSHVYLSPILQATPGSSHGYDVTDPTRLSSDLGGAEAYDRMCRALESHGLGQMVDIVPNHMSASNANPLWQDVLRRGLESPYASFFDLRWHEAMTGPFIHLPVLEADLDRVVLDSRLKLESRNGETVLRYHEAWFPLAPGTAPSTEALESVNADAALLKEMLDLQHYRLVYWRDAGRHIDYRRFFDISGLVALRAEDDRVFDATHRLILELVDRGSIDGLRIDHVDGLRDPLRYLERLDGIIPEGRIVVEKILEAGEQLRDDWPVDGTTGYDFLSPLNGLFVEPAAEATLTGLYRDLTGVSSDFDSVLAGKKRSVIERLFAGDVTYLADLLDAGHETAEWSRSDIESAIRETIVALPVYRTYARPDDEALTDEDARLLATAIDTAQASVPNVVPGVFESLRGLLRIGATREKPDKGIEFLPALQQLSGAAMAKGAEDTAFYNYNRLVSLNEVGCNPDVFGTSLEAFHATCATNAERWPLTMLATSTHDTKRGEDTRLRIDALSELPVEWSVFVHRCFQAHEPYRTGSLPDNNALYLLYQTLVGAWPIDADRAHAYMLKAMREAKAFTSWHDPDEAYERAMHDYIDAVLADQEFLSESTEFVARIDAIARVSSLSQTLLKLTAPGVPDFYQGTELWDHSLVDPDNRRPVDYETRHRLLEELPRMTAQEALDQSESGIPKLWLIWKTLAFRRRHIEAFAGAYTPLYAEGSKADCIVAFMRAGEIITVAPRLLGRLDDGWRDTLLRLPEGRWLNVFTDETMSSGEVAVSDLMRDFPVALLSREESR